jgi:hypothetical protein
MEDILVQPGFTRRRATRRAVGSALALGAVALALTARPALAGRAWCRTDPVVSIDGTLVDIFVAGPLRAPLVAKGPNQVVVSVPIGVEAFLAIADPGFGKGTDVIFKESSKLRRTQGGIEVKVRVFVPTTERKMPVRVEFAPRIVGILDPDTVDGTANRWVPLKTKL